MNAITQPITLDVSRNGTIRTLADQFTSNTTFLKELLQNARRAGASKVEVNYVDGILTLTDDGHGITDPQVLFCIGKSEWQDMDMMAQENPFGIGFAASLFAADRITVESGSWRLDADTADILAFEPLDLEAVEGQQGTRISLIIKDALKEEKQPLCEEKAQELFAALAQAFPIDILFNGELLPAPLRQQQGGKALEAGALQGCLVPVTEEGVLQRWNSAVVIVLQGFVMESLCSDFYFPGFSAAFHRNLPMKAEQRAINPERLSVLHLDSSKVRARVPDRDQLIDRDAVYRGIKEELLELCRARLVEAKANLSAKMFIDSFFHRCQNWGMMHLLNDLPLPKGWVHTVDALAAYGENDVFEWGDEHIQPNAEVFLANLEYEEPDPLSAVCTYLAATRTRVIQNYTQLDAGHWVKANTLDVYANASSESYGFVVKATPIEVLGEATVALYDWMPCSVVICEGISLTPSDSRFAAVEVEKAAVYDCESKTLLVTRGAEQGHISDMLLALDTYGESDEKDRDETLLDKDATKIYQLKILHTSDSPVAVLQQHLSETLGHLAQALAGKSFTVTVDAERRISIQ
ncbi:ATP-binding protein [Vreelandella rituensis]|uniref:ATP-binding protein n=1 Tax=Vreelandella rituensis TaxID=2282306 RepID=A0A368U9H8_9GAMM|nr:ATP-binding protein [Halomonas rituensis]RCV93878.1 hypothetical protein DU506_01595 [Halomonas rituensis]